MFRELVENEDDADYIDNETLIRLFIWFSGNRCCPDFAKITLTLPDQFDQNDTKKYLFSSATCFNDLRIPTYDFSQGYNIILDSEKKISRPKVRFFTTRQKRIDYNKNKFL